MTEVLVEEEGRPPGRGGRPGQAVRPGKRGSRDSQSECRLGRKEPQIEKVAGCSGPAPTRSGGRRLLVTQARPSSA